MDKKTIVLVAIIFILLIVGMIGYAFLKKQELKYGIAKVEGSQIFMSIN
jgi:hypothetical protein